MGSAPTTSISSPSIAKPVNMPSWWVALKKSLTRAVLEVAQMPAKAFIAGRITLEAKCLLAHTTIPIGLISDHVEFDEATNFVKFLKRELGCSPRQFRGRQAGNVRSEASLCYGRNQGESNDWQ
jgi:AraC-like DNA-binding protein